MKFSQASIWASAQQLGRSERGCGALVGVLDLLEGDGSGLDKEGQRAVLTLMLGAWNGYQNTARDADREAQVMSTGHSLAHGLRGALREVGPDGMPLTAAVGMTDGGCQRSEDRAQRLALMVGILRARERGLVHFAAALQRVLRGQTGALRGAGGGR